MSTTLIRRRSLRHRERVLPSRYYPGSIKAKALYPPGKVHRDWKDVLWSFKAVMAIGRTSPGIQVHVDQQELEELRRRYITHPKLQVSWRGLSDSQKMDIIATFILSQDFEKRYTARPYQGRSNRVYQKTGLPLLKNHEQRKLKLYIEECRAGILSPWQMMHRCRREMPAPNELLDKLCTSPYVDKMFR